MKSQKFSPFSIIAITLIAFAAMLAMQDDARADYPLIPINSYQPVAYSIPAPIQVSTPQATYNCSWQSSVRVYERGRLVDSYSTYNCKPVTYSRPAYHRTTSSVARSCPCKRGRGGYDRTEPGSYGTLANYNPNIGNRGDEIRWAREY